MSSADPAYPNSVTAVSRIRSYCEASFGIMDAATVYGYAECERAGFLYDEVIGTGRDWQQELKIEND
jgi:hypothetical protein